MTRVPSRKSFVIGACKMKMPRTKYIPIMASKMPRICSLVMLSFNRKNAKIQIKIGLVALIKAAKEASSISVLTCWRAMASP